MALSHTPLDIGQLSAAAQKALAPGPMRIMAARGLAPLPRPGDLITVLYQLACDQDAKIKAAATKSATDLPDKVLSGALVDGGLDPRVLDFFAGRVKSREGIIDLVILNQATADETIASLASTLNEREIELVASNEQRMLRHPAIIGAMYMNRFARMSTVDRAVELAVRNEVKVPGIPAWEEVARAVLGQGEERTTSEQVDELFALAGRKGMDPAPDAPEEQAEPEDIPISMMTIPMRIRLATLGNSFARSELIRDTNKMVALAAIKAPGVTELEAIKYAGNNSLCEDVVSYIARQREWTKLYTCKLALVGNPKTPLPVAMRFVAHLRDKDKRAISRSKNIPSALATQARKLLMAKQRGGAK